MIDVETEIFSEICALVRKKFKGIFVTGEYVKQPPSFPSVSIVEVSNTTLSRTLTTRGRENHAEVMYEVNVYSNKANVKKTECKEIAAYIDDLLQAKNFTRIMLSAVQNENDATIYRMLGRYRAVIDENKTIYRL